MKLLNVNQIKEAVKGEIINNKTDIKINGIEIDSRQKLKGKLFIAIKGDNFDGHDFILDAFEKGAVCCISEINIDTKSTYIKVKDTKEALAMLAKYYKNLFDIKVVAITGSSGKTTTKDLIASVLEQKYKVLKTRGNFNNEIGLPLTIFRLEEDTDIAVLEMGMNHFGEIHNLSKIAEPDICVITNIGVSHIENLGSREGILKAKTEIFDFMKENGNIVLCGDDDMLKTLSGKNKDIIYYGTHFDNNFCASNIEYNGLAGSKFNILYNDKKINIKINKPGKHMVLNSLAAAAVGNIFGLSENQIKSGIESFESTGMRMEIIKTDKYSILNDVYNANPESMKAAIDVLAEEKGNKVCILGDMLELGKYSSEYHFEIGEYAYRKGINVIVCVGIKSYNIYEGASRDIIKENEQTQRAVYFEKKETLFNNLNEVLQDNDTILVKASRGMHFEKIIEKLLSR